MNRDLPHSQPPLRGGEGEPIRITPLGDSALVIEVGREVDEATHHRVQTAFRLLQSPPLARVTEVVPAFTTITLYYDPMLLAQAAPAGDLIGQLTDAILSRLRGLASQVEAAPGRLIEIPVCYGAEFGSDLAEVATQVGLTPEEVIKRHASSLYLVYLIGFSPGFPYLGGLPESLEMPRRTTPRTSVPPGSVGIANRQSCIYPLATPGGWNLIGRTPAKLFRPEEEPPSLLSAGDRVKFRPITPDEFAEWKEPR